MKTLVLFLALFGIGLAVSCGQTFISDPMHQGTGGSGGTGVAGDGNGGTPSGGSGGGGGIGGFGGCQSPRYYSAGCDVTPRCPNGTGGACAGYACSCSGKIIVGCANEFGEAYAYTIPTWVDGGAFYPDAGYSSVDGGHWVGSTCNPNAATHP